MSIHKDKAAEILKEAADLKVKKSKDYQGGMWSEKDYFPFGDTSYIHMMWTKMLRIRSVAEQANTNFESLEDSLLDMINYSAMYIAYLRDCEQKGKDFDAKYAVDPKDSGERPLNVNNHLTEAELDKAKQLWDLQRKI